MKLIKEISDLKVGDYIFVFSDTTKKEWYGVIDNIAGNNIWCNGWFVLRKEGLVWDNMRLRADFHDRKARNSPLTFYVLTKQEFENKTQFIREIASL